MSRERAPELFLIGISVFLAYLVLTSQNSSGRKRRSSQDSLSSYGTSHYANILARVQVFI